MYENVHLGREKSTTTTKIKEEKDTEDKNLFKRSGYERPPPWLKGKEIGKHIIICEFTNMLLIVIFIRSGLFRYRMTGSARLSGCTICDR